MTTLKQIVCKNCFYENELPHCPNLCPLTFEHVKEWLQQKRLQIPFDDVTGFCTIDDAIQAKFIVELLEELEKEVKE